MSIEVTAPAQSTVEVAVGLIEFAEQSARRLCDRLNADPRMGRLNILSGVAQIREKLEFAAKILRGQLKPMPLPEGKDR